MSPFRLRVRHATRYRYTGAVATSYNEARMTPLSVVGQTTIDARLEIHPAARIFRYWDYWGTLVHAFDIHQPHDELAVTATAVVETSPPPPPPDPIGWGTLARDDQLDHWCEFLKPSRYVPVADALTTAAAQLRLADPSDPLAAAMAANAFVHDRVAYRQGTTTVATSAPEAFAAGNGVCQDFAHILLALLRSMGIPGRYVSGYLYPGAEPEPDKAPAGQSHAWVEAWVGDWVALDPTHGGFIGPHYVLVARGRDYADVTPLKGVFTGQPIDSLEVTVELTRIA